MAREMTFGQSQVVKGYVTAKTPGHPWMGLGKTEQAARADLNKQIRLAAKKK